MDYWKEHPEELEEITISNLPQEWKERLESLEIGLFDVPEDVIFEAMLRAAEKYAAKTKEVTLVKEHGSS